MTEDAAQDLGLARRALGVLTAVYVVNYIDRQIINVLAEPIKNELHLSDTQVGVMTGLAFAIFYSTMGIPIANLAERRHRPSIIAFCLVIWSACTMLCGAAQNFMQLLLARLGVGLGETGSTPASQSLITDYFPVDQRARALAILAVGAPIGGLLGTWLGGLVSGFWGWRWAFAIGGIPGFTIAAAVLTVVKDPCKRLEARGIAQPKVNSFKALLNVVGRKPTYWLMCLASGCFGLFSLGTTAFIISFFLRNHSSGLAQMSEPLRLAPIAFLSLAMGILNGVGGALGSITGGALGDRWFRTNPKAHVTLCALGALAIVPFHMATLLAPTLWLALAAWAGALFFQFFYVGPMWATIQGLAPPGGRATAGAIHLMFANLVGLGVGPLLVGFVSDLLSVRFALGPNDGLRFALVVLELVAIATAALFWACRRYVARDLANPIGQEVAAFHGATPASA